jgi:hypothetical protein
MHRAACILNMVDSVGVYPQNSVVSFTGMRMKWWSGRSGEKEKASCDHKRLKCRYPQRIKRVITISPHFDSVQT